MKNITSQSCHVLYRFFFLKIGIRTIFVFRTTFSVDWPRKLLETHANEYLSTAVCWLVCSWVQVLRGTVRTDDGGQNIMYVVLCCCGNVLQIARTQRLKRVAIHTYTHCAYTRVWPYLWYKAQASTHADSKRHSRHTAEKIFFYYSVHDKQASTFSPHHSLFARSCYF